MVSKRLEPTDRKRHILLTAVEVSKINGYRQITRRQVAMAAGVSQGLISVYFKTMDDLRLAVFAYAVKNEIPEIIAQFLAVRGRIGGLSDRLHKIASDYVGAVNAKDSRRV